MIWVEEEWLWSLVGVEGGLKVFVLAWAVMRGLVCFF